jgi:hypothetical protein
LRRVRRQGRRLDRASPIGGGGDAGAVSISDPDNLNLASATVSVHGRPGTGISTSYDSSNERLVLSGSDKVTLAAGENPINFGRPAR